MTQLTETDGGVAAVLASREYWPQDYRISIYVQGAKGRSLN
jgi:hypothetical protein